MSDEKQPELPGMPAGHPNNAGPIYGIENLKTAPPVDRGEPASLDAGKPAKTSASDAGATTSGPKPRSRKPKAKDTGPVVDNVNAHQPAEPAPSRKRTRGSSVARAADQKHGAVADMPDAGAPVVKTPRAPRKKTVNASVIAQQGQTSVGQAPAVATGIPVVTSEAIAFLGDPDAKAADLFRLQPDSQAFVAYHITNMHRLEAASELARSALAARAPKFSPRFERVADALLASLPRKSLAPAGARTAELAGSASAKPIASYRPRPTGAQVPAYIPVQLGNMEFATHGTRAHENSIEQGIAAERQSESKRGKHDPNPHSVPDTGTTSPSLPSRRVSKRLLRAMGNAAQAAGEWFHNKSDGLPAASPTVGEAHGAKPALPAVPGPSPDDKPLALPEAVAQRFLKVGQDYYFPDKTHAFSDRGNKLATRVDHPEVVRSLIEIAKARFWNSITVKGTDEFRRSAWMEASKSGLSVAGYQPTSLDLAELAQQPANNMVEKKVIQDRSAISAKPATQHSKAAEGNTPKSGKAAKQTSKGNDGDPDLTAKARSFENDKPAFVVKQYPELAPAYGVVDAAKKFAETNLPEAAREEFVGLARRHVIQKIIAGEAVKGPRIYLVPAKDKPASERAENPAQELVDLGKSPRSKEVSRER